MQNWHFQTRKKTGKCFKLKFETLKEGSSDHLQSSRPGLCNNFVEVERTYCPKRSLKLGFSESII